MGARYLTCCRQENPLTFQFWCLVAQQTTALVVSAGGKCDDGRENGLLDNPDVSSSSPEQPFETMQEDPSIPVRPFGGIVDQNPTNSANSSEGQDQFDHDKKIVVCAGLPEGWPEAIALQFASGCPEAKWDAVLRLGVVALLKAGKVYAFLTPYWGHPQDWDMEKPNDVLDVVTLCCPPRYTDDGGVDFTESKTQAITIMSEVLESSPAQEAADFRTLKDQLSTEWSLHLKASSNGLMESKSQEDTRAKVEFWCHGKLVSDSSLTV
eukprot:Blabericola_migrator_1__9461@NODE_512_length_7937_cov_88_036722_g393_i0_p4_GENE_NODE_512_length_7937_cov_88_036722_g393_i0NODE_512_length_7937_cov_88_036722_g393_i0_p4_ORF_typecomplete_len266_score45_94_NODE_512_length_7937_cov_88_036722_g393_i068537650